MPRYQFKSSNSPAVLNRRNQAEQYQSILETDFPKVIEAIVALWGYKELNDYFGKLMMGNSENKIDFSPEAWGEIDLLQHIHEDVVPIYRP
jgi:hypothetical protein